MFTFDEAIDEVRDDVESSVLLGNGFSQAWNAEIFNYENLLEQADFDEQDQTIRELFNHFQTYDFEVVMLRMLYAADVLSIYDADD